MRLRVVYIVIIVIYMPLKLYNVGFIVERQLCARPTSCFFSHAP